MALASETSHSEAGSDLDFLLDSDTASVATEEEVAIRPVSVAQIRRKLRRAGRTTPSSTGEARTWSARLRLGTLTKPW